MGIGKRIRYLRGTLGLDQKEFSSKIGLSRSRLSEIESGKGEPRETVLIQIEKTFNVNPRWLREGEGEMFLKVDTEGVKPQWASDPELIEIIQLLQEDPQAKKLVLKLLKGKKEMQEALQGFKVKVVEEG